MQEHHATLGERVGYQLLQNSADDAEAHRDKMQGHHAAMGERIDYIEKILSIRLTSMPMLWRTVAR